MSKPLVLLSSLLLAGSAGAQTAPPAEPRTEDVPPQQESGEAVKPPPLQLVSDVPAFEMGAALRFGYRYRSWGSKDQNGGGLGDVYFDTFSLRPRAHYKDLSLKAEYRFYAGSTFLRYGYLAYKISDEWEIQVGDTQTPFGILPIPAFDWYDNLTFYIGLEDDSDLGLKSLYKKGNLDVQLAFFKSDEGSFTGSSINSARYGFDLVRTNDTEVPGAGLRTDRETNQGNVRVTYTFQHSKDFQTELGASGMYGGIFNATTQHTGTRWAAAAHLNGKYGPVGVHLQALSYAFNLAGPTDQDRRYVVMGAFDGAHKVAARASMIIANVSYTWQVSGQYIDSVVIYNDHAYMMKPEAGYNSSQQNVTGVHVGAGPVHAFFELIAGRNHPYLGGDVNSLAEGKADAKWGFRPNINLGYYF